MLVSFFHPYRPPLSYLLKSSLLYFSLLFQEVELEEACLYGLRERAKILSDYGNVSVADFVSDLAI